MPGLSSSLIEWRQAASCKTTVLSDMHSEMTTAFERATGLIFHADSNVESILTNNKVFIPVEDAVCALDLPNKIAFFSVACVREQLR
jgi:hypothetical protein